MKIGTENKTKTIIAAVLGLFALYMVYRAFRTDEEPPAPQPVSTATPAGSTTGTGAAAAHRATAAPAKTGVLLAQTLDPTLRTDLLKTSEDVSYKGAGRDIFRNLSEPVPIPKPIVNPVVNNTPPPPPPPPPINLKFYGFANKKGGEKSVFLSSGEDIFVAKEGQIVNRRYKILKVNPTSIDVEDVLTNNRQTIPLTAG